MRTFIAILGLLALISTGAHAAQKPATPANPGGNSHASAAASAKASAVAIAASASKASVSARQSQTSKQANSQTTVYEDQRPSGIAPSIGLGGFASGPCVGVTTQGGFGVGLPGGASFGGSAGRSELDDECTRRETARILHSMGHADLALKVMLTSPTVQAVLPKAPPAAPIVPASAAPAADKHPACSPSSWATAETRKALGC